jgi:hypothetical protein
MAGGFFIRRYENEILSSLDEFEGFKASLGAI